MRLAYHFVVYILHSRNLQALARSPLPEHHEALLRRVHAHAVKSGVIPALLHHPRSSESSQSDTPPMDLRGMRPTLARVALAEALQRMVGDTAAAGQDGLEERERPPLVLITGTGPTKAHVRRFLRSKGCFDPPFSPLPMPYNHGRLLLPWAQIRRWQAAGARARLSSVAMEEEHDEARRRRERLWGGMEK